MKKIREAEGDHESITRKTANNNFLGKKRNIQANGEPEVKNDEDVELAAGPEIVIERTSADYQLDDTIKT